MSIIKSITLRKCQVDRLRKGRYTTGELEPDLVNLIVEITDGQHRGFGEFVPTSEIYPPGHIGRSSLNEWQVLQDACKELIGKDARRLSTLIPESLKDEDANSLVDGIDFAMHDLVGRAYGLPVWSLLGGLARPFVWGMPVIHTASPDEMAETAQREFKTGAYVWYKLKPNGNTELDREAMIKIRERTSAEARFFIDPNYALKFDEDGVIDYLNALRPHGLEVCEDPINVELPVYAAMQKRTDVKMMIDEKARTLTNVGEIIATGAARYVNIHANWAGGFRPGLAKAYVAAEAGMDVIIGSTCYLGFGNAAYQTLSAVIPGGGICEQTNAGDNIDRIATKNQYHTADGKIHIPDAPGLGVDSDDETLEAFTSEKVVLN